MTDMKALFKREILECQARVKAEDEATARDPYRSPLRVKENKASAKRLAKQLECNEADAHDFECDNVSILGSRFEEICKHCGFTNNV